MRVMYSFFQIGYYIHIHIIDLPALHASDMVVIGQCKIESIRPIRNLNLSNRAFLHQYPEVSVDRSLSDGRMIPVDEFVHLFRSDVPLQLVHRVSNQVFLNCISPYLAHSTNLS